MYQLGVILMAGAILATTSGNVSAQTPAAAPATQGSSMLKPWNDRGYFNFNIGFETKSETLSDTTTFSLYDETGTKSVEQDVNSGAFFDLAAGTRVWRNFSVGLGYHHGTNTRSATGAASVPHPILFNRPRQATVAAEDLKRVEQAFHLQFGYMFPITNQFSIHVAAGPSFFRLEQDVIGDITFGPETNPFTTVTATPVIVGRTDTPTGVNVGADLTYIFYDSDAYRIGGGAFIRYSGATARITMLANEVETDVGGLQIGFGARVRF